MSWPVRVKYIGCKATGCLEPHRSRGYCRKHYRKVMGESKKRYQKVLKDPKLFSVRVEAIKKYKQSDRYRELRREHDKKYYAENREEILAYKSNWNELKRFGVTRDEILERDNNQCSVCNETQDLIIHHKDGQGRITDKPNNDPANLITLCRPCHMKIHNPAYLRSIS